VPNYRPDRIKRLREKLGKPQYVVAIDAGMAQGHLSHLEHGNIDSIGSEHLSNLARVLNTNIAYLVGTSDDPRPGGYMREDELGADEERLIRVFRSIQDESLRAEVLHAAERMRRLDRERP